MWEAYQFRADAMPASLQSLAAAVAAGTPAPAVAAASGWVVTWP